MFFTLGSIVALKGVLDFRAASTTVDPTNPSKTTALVERGIYQYSRNPMYVGFYLWLISWGVLLGNGFALLASTLFPVYMTQFQIRPEEQSLESIFGQAYVDYKRRVRRWV